MAIEAVRDLDAAHLRRTSELRGEFYCSGLSVVRDTVALPHARARLLLEDEPRMAVFARRFAPARCVLLGSGMRIDIEAGGSCQPGARILGFDGRVMTLEAP